MKKRNRNLIVLIVVTLVTAMLTVLAWTGMSGFGIKKLVPMYQVIKGGTEYNGGQTYIYQITDEANRTEENQRKNMTLVKERLDLLNSLKNTGWIEMKGITIQAQGGDKIRVDIATNAADGLGYATRMQLQTEVLSSIFSPGLFTLEDTANNVIIDSNDIASAKSQSTDIAGFNSIVLTLTDEGAQKMAEATKDAKDEVMVQPTPTPAEGETEDATATADAAGSSVAVDSEGNVVDEDTISSENGMEFLFKRDGSQITETYITQPVTGNQVVIAERGIMNSAFDSIIDTINAGALTPMTQTAQWSIAASDGGATMTNLVFGILLAIAIIAVILLILYRAGGVSAVLSMLIFGFLLMLGSSTIESIIFSPATIVGLIAAAIIGVAYQILLQETNGRLIRSGNSVEAAARGCLKACMAPVLDSAVVFYLGGAALAFWGGEVMRNFALIFMVGVTFALVCYFVGYGLLILMSGIDEKGSHYLCLGSRNKEISDAKEANNA